MAEPVTIARLGYPHFESTNESDYSNSSYIRDISDGIMVNFQFTYEWTNINRCEITEIKWNSCSFNNDGSLNNNSNFSTNGFTQQNKTHITAIQGLSQRMLSKCII